MKIIIANWKMNVGVRESVALARGTLLTLRGRKLIPELVICPPFVALSEVRKVVARSAVALGAQNVSWAESGSYTGEISARMLQELGVTHAIIGHSERRSLLHETDEMVNKKVLHALASQLTPIVCVGETRQERQAGKTHEVVGQQLKAALLDVRLRVTDRLLIAYEPLSAIGSGEAASVPEIVETHTFIRSLLREFFGERVASAMQILYGGSVDGENAYGFLREQQVDGVLVGGGSVKINQFKDIVHAACEVLEAQQKV
ncbi:MAG: triose-phosphate isomerase [Patescibacteria group bacterium]